MVTLLGTLFTMNGTIIADAYYDGKVHQVIIKDIDHHKLKVSESQNAAYEFLQFCEESWKIDKSEKGKETMTFTEWLCDRNLLYANDEEWR